MVFLNNACLIMAFPELFPMNISLSINQSDFKRRPSSCLCQKARGSGVTPKWEYFFLQKATHQPKISRSATRFHSRKHSNDACFYLARPEGTKRDFQKLNHEVLRGLSILGCFCKQGKDQMLTTSRAKQKAKKKKVKILEIAGPKSFQY